MKIGDSEMKDSRHRLKTGSDWNIDLEDSEALYKLEIAKYVIYLKTQGYRNSTVIGYESYLYRFLKYSQTTRPQQKHIDKFYEYLLTKNISKSTYNQYSYAIKSYLKMQGIDFKPKILKRDNKIPRYFTKEEIDKIFSAIYNIKHLAMFMTGFYACLRSSELANIEDQDLDLKSLSIRINSGKGGKDGIVFINDRTAQVLTAYLRMRPPLLIDDKQYLFYTDYGRKWTKESIYDVFQDYKDRAGISKKAGPHVFFRASPATLMVSRGCDIRIVKDILRHSDIRTTLRYVFVEDQTKRTMYDKYLIL
ncbi:MAG: tyrosine-type recombinase/integrase [bacterium]